MEYSTKILPKTTSLKIKIGEINVKIPSKINFDGEWKDIEFFLSEYINSNEGNFISPVFVISKKITKLTRCGMSKELFQSLYNFYANIFKGFISKTKELGKSYSSEITSFLVTMRSRMRMIEEIFAYFTAFELRQNGYKSLSEFIETIFSLCLSNEDSLVKSLMEESLVYIQEVRIDNLKNSENSISIEYQESKMKVINEIFNKINYSKIYETQLCSQTENFYIKNILKANISFEDYLLKCQKSLSFENQQIGNWVNPKTRLKLINSLEIILLTENINFLSGDGFKILLKKSDFQNLQRLYDLFKQISAQDTLKKAFFNYIKQDCTKFEKIDDFITYKKKILQIIVTSFENSNFLIDTMNYGFESSIEENSHLISYLLSKCLDFTLRNNCDISYIENLLYLFKRIASSSKDIIKNFYTDKFLKRMINISYSEINFKLENYIIDEFQKVCGDGFMSSFKKLLQQENWQACIEFQDEFMKNKDFEFHVVVIENQHWPGSINLTYKPGEPFDSIQKTFTAFYKGYCDNKKLTGKVTRELTWLYDKSTCIVEGHFDKKVHLRFI